MLQLERRVDERGSVRDQADVARRTADVAAQQVAYADQPAEVRAGHRACGGAREHDPERLLHGDVRGNELGGAVREVQLTRETQLAESAVQLSVYVP